MHAIAVTRQSATESIAVRVGSLLASPASAYRRQAARSGQRRRDLAPTSLNLDLA
jgi:hypothetical protein